MADPTPQPEPHPDAEDQSLEALAAEDLEQGGEEPPVWEKMLPWTISLMVHVGIVMLAIFVVFVAGRVQEEDKRVVPSLRLSDNPGAPLEMPMEPMLEQELQAEARLSTQSTVVTPTLDAPSLGVGSLAGAVGDPFQSVGSQDSLQSSFMGNVGGDARSIVFVIDASGSLIDTFPFVIEELQRSIQQLSPAQSFHVIFFTGDSPRPILALNQAREMFQGTATDKARVSQWIDIDEHNVQIGGQGNPIPAITSALRFRPELVYLLSDNITGSGQFEVRRDRLLGDIRNANTNNTQICTIQFVYPDPLATDAAGQTDSTMALIAQTTGGSFRYVSEQDLQSLRGLP